MINIPGVLWTDKNKNTRMIDLHTRLLCDRIIMCTDEITNELAESVVAQLLYLESEDPKKPIQMLVSGPGGSCNAGLSIISTMNTISCPVYTTVIGDVASMSAVISVSGKKGFRKSYSTSRVMLHYVATGMQGKLQDIQITLEEARKTNEVIFEILSKCCGKDTDILKKDCDRDFWMSASEAIEYGALDAIVEKHTAPEK